MARASVTISGSRVLLTGATGGLGGAIAHALDERGARLVLTGRQAHVLEALTVTCDLAEREQLDELITKITDVDILVANAALPAAGTLDDCTPDELDRALDVNLRAPMHLAPRAIAAHGGPRSRSDRLHRLDGWQGSRPSIVGLRGDEVRLARLRSVSPTGAARDRRAESGVHSNVGTVTSAAVAAGVIRAIERDKAEVEVAPRSVRVGALIANLAPETFARVARRSGADEQTAVLAEGLRHKR